MPWFGPTNRGFTPAGSSGSFNHGDPITIIGGPFGTKSGSTPKIWDHGQDGAGNVNGGFTGAWPSTAGNSVANFQNRAAPFQALGSSTINGPHPYTNVFLGGNHYQSGATGGNNVMAWTKYTLPSFPFYSYWSYYFRHDPNWCFAIAASQQNFTGTTTSGSNIITGIAGFSNIFTTSTIFGQGLSGGPYNSQTTVTGINTGAGTLTTLANATATGTSVITAFNNDLDNNTKTFDFSSPGNSPYDSQNWYDGIGHSVTTGGASGNNFVHPNSNTDSLCNIGLNDDVGFKPGTPSAALENPDENAHGNNWNATNNPTNAANGIGGFGWIKGERLITWTTATSGLIKYWENNTYVSSAPSINYAGSTVYSSITTACEAIGGFCRFQGPFSSDTTKYGGAGTVGTYCNWRYLADTYNDRGTGRFIMTNSATYVQGDGNIVEPQPYTSWANGSVNLTINKGNLSAGTARIWFVDEANGVSTPVLQKTITLN